MPRLFKSYRRKRVRFARMADGDDWDPDQIGRTTDKLPWIASQVRTR
jgi:hypothetical protein